MSSDLRDEILAIRTGDHPERLVEGVAKLLDAAGVCPWRVSSALHVFHSEILVGGKLEVFGLPG